MSTHEPPIVKRPPVKPWKEEIMPGVILARGKTGSVGVVVRGDLAGWLHASSGKSWNAVAAPGIELGKFPGDAAAVRAIVRAFHRKSA